jgi:hypothetical protein
MDAAVLHEPCRRKCCNVTDTHPEHRTGARLLTPRRCLPMVRSRAGNNVAFAADLTRGQPYVARYFLRAALLTISLLMDSMMVSTAVRRSSHSGCSM